MATVSTILYVRTPDVWSFKIEFTASFYRQTHTWIESSSPIVQVCERMLYIILHCSDTTTYISCDLFSHVSTIFFFVLVLMDWMFRTTCCYFHIIHSYFLLPSHSRLFQILFFSCSFSSFSSHILLVRSTEWIFIMHFSINLLEKFIYGSSSTFNGKSSIVFFTSSSHAFSTFLLFWGKNHGHAQ